MNFGNVPRAIGASRIKDVDVITPAKRLQTGWQIPFFIFSQYNDRDHLR